jgi:diamine N-acetyltransferase
VKSLAAAYIHPHGDQYEHTPMGIYSGDTMVGYVSTLCDPNTTDDHWIDDIMIDARYQGKGFGRAAVAATIRFILQAHQQCETIKLSCHRSNKVAAALYVSMGFELTGDLNAMTGEPNYRLPAARLREYR